jgi:hypothetical protein
MAEVDSSIFRYLKDSVKGGYDEERFGSRIGFNNLKKCVFVCVWRGGRSVQRFHVILCVCVFLM